MRTGLKSEETTGIKLEFTLRFTLCITIEQKDLEMEL